MKKIILDTDLGGDCDDVGALAVLLNLAKAGKAEVLAVTYCIGNPWGGYLTRHMLDARGFTHVPLGVLKEPEFMSEPFYERYTRAYCEAFDVAKTENDDAVRVLRRTLANNGGTRDVTLVAIGPLRNIANLLASEPDDISPLTGRELVEQNVCLFATMLGQFNQPDAVEWNVKMDIPSAVASIAQMPVPTLFCPFECGSHIFTGANNEAQAEDHHVRFSYLKFSEGKSFLRQSWDPVTVYAAVIDDTPLYTWRETHVKIDGEGHCVENGEKGMYVLTQRGSDAEITTTIDALMI